jgi:putative intracellular protease/amidase
MYTFVTNKPLHQKVIGFYERDKIVAVVCHAASILLHARTSDGQLLVNGKTWTGFANTNFITAAAFMPFAIREGRLITGQQQYSGAAAAELLIRAPGE